MRGRKPASLAALKARGSPDGKHRPAPDFQKIGPDPPTPLTGEARETWDAIVAERGEVFRDLDARTLCLYCTLWAAHVELTAKVQREGVTIIAPSGAVHKNPTCNVLAETNSLLLRVASDCGLTPATASKLRSVPKADPDSILRFVRMK